jgi:NADP-dependent 3-hydroxy acid dehydrogenase YdfG
LSQEWQAVDVLINNAGLVIGLDKKHQGNLDEWDVVIDTKLKDC